jgi:2-iminobutanoate/2-iminopropanoate deaminase
MEFIKTSKAPAPAGHYSQAVVYNDLIFISGQLPINPETNRKITGSIEEQADQVLKNVKAILEAAGSNLQNVLKTTVYISDISLWGPVNEIYAAYFGNHKPARAIVPTRELHHGFNIEIEAVAKV